MGWLMKTSDIFDICASCASRSFALNLWLDMNGFPSKSGSGEATVKQAHAGDFEELEKYCLDDAVLKHHISMMQRIAIPEGYAWRKKHAMTKDTSIIIVRFSNYQELFEIPVCTGNRKCRRRTQVRYYDTLRICRSLVCTYFRCRCARIYVAHMSHIARWKPLLYENM